MRNLLFAGLTAVLLLLLAASCGGSGQSAVLETDPLGQLPAESTLRSGAFALQLLGDNAALGISAAELRLEQQTLPDGGIRVDILRDGSAELHGLAIRLSYDPLSFHPLTIEKGELLAALPGELLEISERSTAGQLDYGLVQANYAELPGSLESGSLLSMNFAPGPAGLLRTSSAAPTSESARTQLRITSNVNQNLNWFFRSPGDYDENGEVNVGDLTPLGQHFGESGDFLYFHKTYQIDGDGNGEINISDLTTIGSNYGRQIAEYAVYSSTDPDNDYPAGSTSPELLAPLAIIPHSDYVESSPTNRIGFSFPLEDLQPDDVFWVRPLDQTGNPGIASNRTDLPSGLPNGTLPVPFISADLLSGEVPISINFNMSDSYDPDGDALEFKIQLSDGVHVINSTKGANALVSMDIVEPGNYEAVAQVFSDGGSSFSSPLSIIATKDGNHQPVADLQLPGPLMGDAPFTVELDMSGSTDADGDKLHYALAIYSSQNPDGLLNNYGYVHDNGGLALGEYVIEQPGIYHLSARVWDPGGLSDDSDEVKVIVTEAGNQAPVLSLQALGASGAPPLEVRFVYNTDTSYDPDGEIVKFEFDPLGTGDWTEFNWENNDFIYTYTEGGVYNARVRALDNDGLHGYANLASLVRVSGDTGIDPVAFLQASAEEGVGYLTVDFDGSTSSDADGEIIRYEVNFNDGLGWLQLGLNPLFSQGFPKGDYVVTLRVTDQRGNNDTYNVVISVDELPIGF